MTYSAFCGSAQDVVQAQGDGAEPLLGLRPAFLHSGRIAFWTGRTAEVQHHKQDTRDGTRDFTEEGTVSFGRSLQSHYVLEARSVGKIFGKRHMPSAGRVPMAELFWYPITSCISPLKVPAP
jgi:hypothetical protein